MTTISHVAVLGAGTIGASWAANFLAGGRSVCVSDPSPTAKDFVLNFIDAAWPDLAALGLAAGADPGRVTFHPNPADAVEGAQFVQESAPERLDVKLDLFDRIEAALAPDAIVASSSSTLTPSSMQVRCGFAGRLLVAHPFNPPHLIPLVEVCGGGQTAPATIDSAMRFYHSIGKHPIQLRKEIPGHVSNRLQYAIWREAAYLVEQGVVDVTDVDAAVSQGPGLRWALMGPILTFHLGGGQGGLRHLLEHIPIDKILPLLGTPDMSASLRETLIAGVHAEAGERSMDGLVEERNRKLLGILLSLRRTTDGGRRVASMPTGNAPTATS